MQHDSPKPATPRPPSPFGWTAGEPERRLEERDPRELVAMIRAARDEAEENRDARRKLVDYFQRATEDTCLAGGCCARARANLAARVMRDLERAAFAFGSMRPAFVLYKDGGRYPAPPDYTRGLIEHLLGVATRRTSNEREPLEELEAELAEERAAAEPTRERLRVVERAFFELSQLFEVVAFAARYVGSEDATDPQYLDLIALAEAAGVHDEERARQRVEESEQYKAAGAIADRVLGALPADECRCSHRRDAHEEGRGTCLTAGEDAAPCACRRFARARLSRSAR